MSPRHRKGPHRSSSGGAGAGGEGHPSPARCWPLPDRDRILPSAGDQGSFWEDRGDRRHAGVDLYAPAGSRVVAIEEGTVISAGIFTGPDLVPYWNRTYQVTVAHVSGIFCRYAELGDVAVRKGGGVEGGTLIGHVGEVLNPAMIGADSPSYIRALRDQGRTSMLHLEVFDSVPAKSLEYRGGNWFSRARPPGLVDPIRILRDIP